MAALHEPSRKPSWTPSPRCFTTGRASLRATSRGQRRLPSESSWA